MSYNIFPTDGDTITESDWTAILDRANARDYVERGLGVTLNGDGTFDVGAGLAFIRDSGNNQTYPVKDESGTTGVQLADTSTTNYIYLTFDPSASDVEGSVEYHVDTDQTPPAGQPSLLISTADESTSTVTPRNQEPSLSADQADVADTATDPSADGELRRNGSDVKVHSGGAVQNLSDVGSGGPTTTIDDTNSPYLTQDEDVIYCDASSGAVTVQLASADATLANEIRVVNIDATNAVTVETEGSETIDPNAEASKTVANAGWAVAFVSDGSNWDTTLAGEFESVTTETLVIGGTLYEEDANSPLNASGSTVSYSISGSYDEVIILITPGGGGHNAIRVNGDSGSNYDYVDNSDAQTTGQTEWQFGRIARDNRLFALRDAGSEIGLSADLAVARGNRTVAGSNGSEGGNGLNSIEFVDTGGSKRSIGARILGRTVDV